MQVWKQNLMQTTATFKHEQQKWTNVMLLCEIREKLANMQTGYESAEPFILQMHISEAAYRTVSVRVVILFSMLSRAPVHIILKWACVCACVCVCVCTSVYLCV